MCGVTALLLGDTKADTVAIDIHESLYFLQHRGQDAAGITVCQGGQVYQCKGNGMAAKVFAEGKRISDLPGYMGVGHLRYPTAGTSSESEAQPFYVNSPFGLVMGVNGNLVNTTELRNFLDVEARRHVNTASDSELLLNVYAHALNELGKVRANVDDVFTALEDVYSRCHGAFACTAMIAGYGILGFRDANGIRPLCIGSRPSITLEGAMDYFIASESIALRQLGFSQIKDILPGQAVFTEKGGVPHYRQIVERKSYTPDIFELVYFSRPDSYIDGLSVHRSRQNMGVKLAEKMRETLGEEVIQQIDLIIPVPETSITAAAALAQSLNKPISNAFVKNRYVYRTFILPGQRARRSAVRRKLSPIDSEFRGKSVCLVDDSIVRGTTSREIVQMARESGATRVYLASCSPEVIYPHIYGIDLADHSELIAHRRSLNEIAKQIDADDVVYQDLKDLKTACVEAAVGKSVVKDFEVGVFCGKYKTEVPEGYFDHLSQSKAKKRPISVRSGDVEEEEEEGTRKAVLVANSGPLSQAIRSDKALNDGNPRKVLVKGPKHREDVSLYNLGNDSRQR